MAPLKRFNPLLNLPVMDKALLIDLYELTMAQSYFVYKKETCATFDLFVRQLPKTRAYLIFCGLSDILDYIKTLKFDKDDLAYLKRTKLFSHNFLEYLKHFRFRGGIWAMREGEIFFANEPVLRVTGSILETQIIESFLLNTVNLQPRTSHADSGRACQRRRPRE